MTNTISLHDLSAADGQYFHCAEIYNCGTVREQQWHRGKSDNYHMGLEELSGASFRTIPFIT